MQRKKNIRLLIILIVLVVVTCGVYLYRPTNDNPDKLRFTLTNVESVNRVEITNKEGRIELKLAGRQWKLNTHYAANLARINDLYVIMENVATNRKVPTNEQVQLDSLFNQNGAVVILYSNDAALKTWHIVENEEGTQTYFIDENGTGYVGVIPGYNYHIAQLFNLDAQGWRSNYIFTTSWSTLEQLTVNYNDNSGIEIRYDPSGYYIQGVNNLDTAKMYSYLEQISFLQASQFLTDTPYVDAEPNVNIAVHDAGGQSKYLSFYESGAVYYGQIDSIEWGIFRRQDILNLMQDQNWFEKEEN